MKICNALVACGAAAISSICIAGEGGVQFFGNRTAWEAATGGRVVVATFSESLWPVNQGLPGDWTLNGVTYRGLAGVPGPNIFVFNPSALTGPALTANGDEDIEMELGAARRAVGFDVKVNRFGPVTVSAYAPGGSLLGEVEVAPDTLGFVGMLAPGAIGSVRFRSVMGALEDSLLDNVTLGDSACAADFNGDGFVNPDDLSDFITCFFLEVQFPGTCAQADFNADQFINPDDLSDFITTFFLGC